MNDDASEPPSKSTHEPPSTPRRPHRAHDRDEQRKSSPDDDEANHDQRDGAKAEPIAQDDDNEPTPQEKRRSRRRKWIIAAMILGLIVIGLPIGIPLYLHAQHFEKTDDAFIDAHIERASPQVSGRVLRVLVEDNQLISANQPLVEIDPADFQVAVQQAEAGLAEANAKVAQAIAQQHVAEANVAQGQADVEQAQANLENANAELKRYETLSAEAISRQRLDDLRTAARNAAAQLKATQEKLAATRAQVTLAQSQLQAGQATVQSATSQLNQAKLNLSYTTVKSAIAGRVTRRQVQAGDYVKSGQPLMIIVPREMWVTANFKETQLTHMRPGQEVTISVDAFPDHDLRGHVQSIQAGAGAWFSLLPPENATGNYVKVVQRVPVKITFDVTDSDEYRKLGPGMSVVPKVRVR